MNPLTNVKNITKLNERELASGSINKKSWHDMYKDSAWIFIGGLAYGLTEGDILAVFSQYGEIVNINLVRDKKTGKTKGFCFLCYANQKSTVLAVDNFNGIKLCNRTIRVDHVANYKPPKEDERDDEITKMLKSEGCAPKPVQVNENDLKSDQKHEKKKSKKEKKERKKKKRKNNSSESDLTREISARKKIKVKEEKYDSGYEKYDVSNKAEEKQHPEKSCGKLLGESSHLQHKLDIENRKSTSTISLVDRNRSEESSQYRKVYKDGNRNYKSYKDNYRSKVDEIRKNDRSESDSSSYDNSRKYSSQSSAKHKSKYLENMEKHNSVRHISTSSDTDNSSTQSFSDDGKRSRQIFQKGEYRTYSKKSASQHSITGEYNEKNSSKYTSGRSKHDMKMGKYSRHNSDNEYRYEENFTHQRRNKHNRA